MRSVSVDKHPPCTHGLCVIFRGEVDAVQRQESALSLISVSYLEVRRTQDDMSRRSPAVATLDWGRQADSLADSFVARSTVDLSPFVCVPRDQMARERNIRRTGTGWAIFKLPPVAGPIAPVIMARHSRQPGKTNIISVSMARSRGLQKGPRWHRPA